MSAAVFYTRSIEGRPAACPVGHARGPRPGPPSRLHVRSGRGRVTLFGKVVCLYVSATLGTRSTSLGVARRQYGRCTPEQWPLWHQILPANGDGGKWGRADRSIGGHVTACLESALQPREQARYVVELTGWWWSQSLFRWPDVLLLAVCVCIARFEKCGPIWPT